MEFHTLFRGTPGQVASIALELSNQFLSTLHHYPYQVVVDSDGHWEEVTRQSLTEKWIPGFLDRVRYLHVNIITPGALYYIGDTPNDSVHISVQIQPDGNSLLTVSADDSSWTAARAWWERLEAELLKIEAQEPAEPAVTGTQNASSAGQHTPDATAANCTIPERMVQKENGRASLATTRNDDEWGDLPSATEMKKFYQGYSPETMKDILAVLAQAYDDHITKGGRWGPGIIAKHVHVNATTIGRYLNALRKAGVLQWRGVPLPSSQIHRQG